MGPWEARSTLGQIHEEQTSLPALVLKGKSRDFQELPGFYKDSAGLLGFS